MKSKSPNAPWFVREELLDPRDLAFVELLQPDLPPVQRTRAVPVPLLPPVQEPQRLFETPSLAAPGTAPRRSS